MRRRGLRSKRSAGLALVAVLVLATGADLAGCSDPVAAPPTTHATGRNPPPTANPSPTTTVQPPAPTMSEMPLVDVTRPVVDAGVVLAVQRNLPTYVWTPAGRGPFPLVVFVHGYDTGPLDYQRFCSTLASAGYVVAAPSFPQEDPARGFPLDETHLADEARDVTFVITSLINVGAAPVARSRIAVVGHSDGADVALLVGYGSGSVDPRVGAVVADAPDPMSVPPVASDVPLLLVQGTADSVVPYSDSRTVYGQVDAPVFYVSLIGADHLPPIAGATPWTPVLDTAVAQFLSATVAGRTPEGGALTTALAASPLVKLESKA